MTHSQKLLAPYIFLDDEEPLQVMENIVETPDQERSKSADLLICDCFQVKASAIHEAINEGNAQTICEVTRQTSAGSGCGSCQCRIQRILAGFPAECGPCALCPGCGYVRSLCNCQAA